MQLSGPPIYNLYNQIKAKRDVKPAPKRKAVDKGGSGAKRRKGEAEAPSLTSRRPRRPT
jgi:hypothetical protein